jgi:hypothetical protein
MIVERIKAMSAYMEKSSNTAISMVKTLNDKQEELVAINGRIGVDSRILASTVSQIHALSADTSDLAALNDRIETVFRPMMQSYTASVAKKAAIEADIQSIVSIIQDPVFSAKLTAEREAVMTDEQLIDSAKVYVTASQGISVDAIPSPLNGMALGMEEFDCEDRPLEIEPCSIATLHQAYFDKPTNGRTHGTRWFTPALVLDSTFKEGVGRAYIVCYNVKKDDQEEVGPEYAVVGEEYLKGPPKARRW